jgi:alcohol dehydrogenase (cytochrome c)
VPWINPKIKPGERRKVITGIPGKTGLVYTLDRQTGEFLWARPTVFQNVISKIDGATGEVTVNPEATFSKLGKKR